MLIDIDHPVNHMELSPYTKGFNKPRLLAAQSAQKNATTVIRPYCLLISSVEVQHFPDQLTSRGAKYLGS